MAEPPPSSPALGRPSAVALHHGLDSELAGSLRAAQAGILARPRFSIRLRLVASLALCFLLCAGFAVATLAIAARVRADEDLLQAIERVKASAGDALASHAPGEGDAAFHDALRHLDQAAATLSAHRAVLVAQGRGREAATLTETLASYRDLLAVAGKGSETGSEPGRDEAIRGRVVATRDVIERVGDGLVAGQRAALERSLRLSHQALLVFLALLLGLFTLITYFFAGALIGPIRRFQAYTRQIAAGDFSLIVPARTYRDEFSDLALAVNQMLAELQAHQDRCVKAGKLAAIGTITSGIAHELNNPLNNISITTEALMEDLATLSDEEKWRLLQDVYFETERATEIVRSLLDFTRHEKPELIALDLAEVIQSTVRLAQNEMVINNVTCECTLPADLPHVLGATNQLRQVFLNLFLNAVQAMPGGGRLEVSAAVHEEGKVCVDVRDEGVGIPADVLPRIFDPFFTTKEPGKGSGLGLSVSYSIIKKFGGDIQVSSEAGRGAAFHVCLPVASGR